MYPLSGRRSAPTTDRATWCRTPAAASAASRLRVDFSKNSSTSASPQDGAFDTSTTTAAPASAPASPSPVRALTPEEGDAGTASWPCWRRIGTSFFPMSPLPPITTIFMLISLEKKLFDFCHRPASQLVRVVGHVHSPDPALDVQGHDLNHRAAGGEHHTRLAVARGRVHLVVSILLAEQPGQESCGPLPPVDHDSRRRHLAAAIGVDLDVLRE